MASQKPNDARLKSAAEFKKSEFSGSGLASSTLRAGLFALHELETEVEPDDVMSHLRDGTTDYLRKRDVILALTRYLDLKLTRARPEDAQAARVLTGLAFMQDAAGRSKNVILGTATPIQTATEELWNLLDVLAEGAEFVMGRLGSPW